MEIKIYIYIKKKNLFPFDMQENMRGKSDEIHLNIVYSQC